MVCKSCGNVLTDHVENVEEEYDQILNNPRKVRVKLNHKSKNSPQKPSGQTVELKEPADDMFTLHRTDLLDSQMELGHLSTQINNFLNH